MGINIWKEIPGYEGLYLISSRGEILSLRSGKFRKCTRSGNGYRKISLSSHDHKKRQFLVHRLVAETFIGKSSDLRKQINHKNLDKTDNRLENLEWVTPQENMNHAYANGRTDFRRAKRADNTSGFTGVSAKDGGYQATIGYDGIVHYIGWFKSLEAAKKARKSAERRLLYVSNKEVSDY
ncbi:MAG: NUMOD4 motif-containing HNH endonuclease [Youngiibacter sp.]|nr:NUMOD4 motif-containing HNH endonuclease [Youngiibacter sp.]